jgi:tetratricopeptide (TPR) repeat protein
VEGAVKLLAQAVELDPGLADAQYNLGIGLWRLNQSEAAIRAMQEAARLQPDDYDAHMRLGAWLAASGRRGEAVVEYERAAGLKIESPEAWMRLAQVYDAAGRSRPAVEAYRRVLGLLGRDDPLVLEALLSAAMHAEDGPTAVEAAQKFLARRPDHEGFLLLGDALLLSKQPEAAIQEYRKAIALAPSAARGHLKLAAAYVQMNQPEPATEQLIEAVRLEPIQPEPYQALSRLYEQSGRLDLAIVALRDGINASVSAAPTVRAELADRLAILYERAGMSREAEAERYRAQTLRHQ